jgi:hypothetical protein
MLIRLALPNALGDEFCVRRRRAGP